MRRTGLAAPHPHTPRQNSQPASPRERAVGGDQLRAVEDDAIRDVVRMQEENRPAVRNGRRVPAVVLAHGLHLPHRRRHQGGWRAQGPVSQRGRRHRVHAGGDPGRRQGAPRGHDLRFDDTSLACRGNFRSSWEAEGGYELVAEALFNDLKVDGFFMEYDDARSGSFEPLRFVPKGKVVVIGLVTSKRGELEDSQQLLPRIEEASRYVDVDQLCLSPQCGFASAVEGNALTHEQHRQAAPRRRDRSRGVGLLTTKEET